MLPKRTRIGLWSVTLLTGLVGVINVLSAVNLGDPKRVSFLQRIYPFEVQASGHVFSAISGFILLMVATHLLRRKRVAWLLAVGLLIVSIVSHLIKGLDVEESLVAGVLLLQLLWMQDVFTAESDRPSIQQGVRGLIWALVFTLAYGTAGFWFLDGQFQTNFNFRQAILQTLAVFFTADNAGLEPKTEFGAFFIHSLYIVGATTIVFALTMLLRPVLLRESTAPQVQRRARAIIDQYGQTSLARLALLSDKSYFFSPSGQSVVAYVAKGRAAISLGSPIGPIDDQQEAIVSFRQFCDRNDWYAAFYEIPPQEVELYRSLKFRLLKVGEEAIVDLNAFTLKGKDNQNLRTAINRLTKAGYTFALYEPPIAAELLQQLKPVSDEWLRAMNGSEKRFSIGWFDESYLQDCQIATVSNAEGHVIAFANLLSGYNQNEVTVDLMRYAQGVPNGTMDFLFVSVFQKLQQLGYERFNFSLSPLAGLGETPKSPRLERVLRLLSNHFNQFYSFHGLHFFKEKFHPHWEPRYLAYPSLTALSDVVVGLVRADSGDRLLDYIKPGS